MEGGKIPYPKSIPFILTTEFCERFSYYGMRAILVLFVTRVIGFSDTDASVLFHGFTVVAYLTPILGAVLADSFIGKFKTIFYVSILYAIGQVVIVLSSVGNTDQGIPGLPMTALLFIGLGMVGFGTGGIKPCVATFGGDQFKMPEQKSQSELFFSIFYWAVNLGSFLSMIITPIIRSNVSCLGQDYCYPLAFGIPAGLMLVAVTIFFIGRVFNMYKINLPDRNQENIIKKTVRCIWFSLRAKKVPGETHWLDRGRTEFGESFASDVKAVYNVAFMMLPLPIFWALFDQQGSRWTLQAARMDGNFFGVFTFEPDNIQVANAAMILVMIPIFNSAIYPLLERCNLLTTSLQRVGLGFFFAALAFGVSGLLDLELEKTYPVLPASGFGQVQPYALLPNSSGDCQINFNLGEAELTVQSALASKFQSPPDIPAGLHTLEVLSSSCPGLEETELITTVAVTEGESTSIIFWLGEAGGLEVSQSDYLNRIEMPGAGKPYVKVLWSGLDSSVEHYDLVLKRENNPDNSEKWDIIDLGNQTTVGDTKPEEVRKPTDFVVFLNEEKLGDVTFKQGANYNLLLVGEGGKPELVVHQVTPENTLSMFWQLPQYVIMTAGEILFSISTMEFCFTQAPVSMKAVTLGLRYLTNAVGNIIDIVVMKSLEGVLPKQAYEFFLFGGLTLVFMAIFILMSLRYKYVDYTNTDTVEEPRHNAHTSDQQKQTGPGEEEGGE